MTTQMMATATITPIGTTTLSRARSQLVVPCRSNALERATAANACPFLAGPPQVFCRQAKGQSLRALVLWAAAHAIRVSLLTQGKPPSRGRRAVGRARDRHVRRAQGRRPA